MFWTSILNSLLTLSFVHCSLHFCRISTIARSGGIDVFILPQQNLGNLPHKWGRGGIYINRVSWSRVGSWKSSKYLGLTKYLSWKELSLQGEKEEIQRRLYVPEFTCSCCCAIGICSELEFFRKLGRVSQHCSALCRCTPCITEVLEMRGGLKGQEIGTHRLLSLPELLAGTLELLAENCFGKTQPGVSLVESPQHKGRIPQAAFYHKFLQP